MKAIYQKCKGYTLLEMLLSISLILMVTGIAYPMTSTFLNQNNFFTAIRLSVRALRSAQIYAVTRKYDSAWGTYIQSGSITLFSGNTYASRNTQYDEVTIISSKIAITGNQEITFSKMIGTIPADTSFTLTGADQSKTIQINTKGGLTY